MQLARRSVLDTTLTTLPSLTLACSEDDCIFERRRKFERLGRTLTVDQDFAGSRSRSTGAGVWECSEVLSAYLAARPELCRGRRVLELGAGCGLCSMVASLGGAARVVATDGDAGAVAHLEDVLRANDVKLETPPPLKWEEATRDSAKALGAPFDVVLGADLTYNPNNAIALANALVAHAGPDSTVLLAHKRRVADDDATIAKLGEYFSTETLVAPSKVAGVAILELRKRDAKLGDLDLAAASADNCNEGFKRVDGACLLATRRAALGILASAAAAPLAAAAAPLAGRFESLDLAQPEPDRGRSELSGVANLYFPPWMRGTWNVSQTLTRVEAPLGLKFIGGPRADLDIAKRSLDEQRSRVGKTQPLQLRFVATKFGVVEDRLFNTRSRLDAFAGRRVVASVEYAETGGNNRRGNAVLGGSEDDPLTTTVTRYRGPAAQKIFSLARTSETDGDVWRGSEATRSIFALTNQNAAPPITTDSETLFELTRGPDGAVRGRLRLVDYLNPTDPLYFEARKRGVSVSDYDLVLRRAVVE